MQDKKDDESTLAFFDTQLSILKKDIEETVFKNTNRILQEYTNKGGISGGMAFKELELMLRKEIKLQFTDSLLKIESFQKDMNITISDNILDEIAKDYKRSFESFFISSYETLEEISMNNLNRNIICDTTRNIIFNEIDSYIKSIFKEIKIKNKVKKDAPSLIVSKKALVTSRIAIFVSVVFGIITLYMNIYLK